MEPWKIVLAVVGAAGILVVAGLGATGLYAYNLYSTAPVLTTADLEKGGAYSSSERSGFKAACAKNFGTEASCECLAGKAGTELSRFERHFMAATFEMSPARMVQVSAAAAAGGIPEQEFDKVTETISGRLQPLMASCGWDG